MRAPLDAPIATRVYAVLLRCYPARFRARFAQGMRHAFLHDHAAARARGRAALVRLWSATIVQAVALGLAERWPFDRRSSAFPETRSSTTSALRVECRDALRALAASRVITLVAVLSLALGIGANTALFTILNSLVLRALPVRNPGELVMLDAGPWTNPIWEAMQRRQRAFAQGAFAWSNERFDLSPGGLTDFVNGAFVSGAMFDVLGTPAEIGRPLLPADDIRAQPVAAAVITHDFWERRFGGAPDVIGRNITLQRIPFTIVGVMPPGFFGPDVGRSADVMVPIAAEPLVRGADSALNARTSWWLYVMARVKSGESADAATSALQAIQPQIREETWPPNWPGSFERYLKDPFTLSPAATGRSPLRTQYQQPLAVIFGVVALVLLVACANLANLMIARASARRHELGLRLALGASRLRLVRQLMIESLMLSAAGTLLGLVVADWGSRLLVAQISTSTSTVALDLTPDWRVLAFTSAAGVLTALLFGLAPSLGVFGISATEALAAHGRRVAGDSRLRVRNALVVVQIALSLVLLTAALLFARTFAALVTRPLGFNPDPLLVATVDTLRTKVPDSDRLALFQRLIDAAAAVPGVAAASGSALTPVGGGSWNGEIEIPGGPELSRRERAPMINAVMPGWFAAYGMPIREGRDIRAEDANGAPRVAVVNAAFARRYFPERRALGQRVLIESGPGGKVPCEIVGLVDDAVYRTLRAQAPPTMYFSFAQGDPGRAVSISIRSAGPPPAALTRALAAALTGVDPDIALTVRPLSERIGASLTQDRVVTMLSGFFGVLALLLSALGLYGITAFAVNRRRAEIGIRLALGAPPASIVRMVLSRIGWMIAIGTAIGAGVSLWAARFVDALVYGLPARDPLTLAAAAGLLAIAGLTAAWRPARRAAALDPVDIIVRST